METLERAHGASDGKLEAPGFVAEKPAERSEAEGGGV